MNSLYTGLLDCIVLYYRQLYKPSHVKFNVGDILLDEKIHPKPLEDSYGLLHFNNIFQRLLASHKRNTFYIEARSAS